MLTLLQWLGGTFYLLNKLFLSLSERARRREKYIQARRWRIAAWTIYLAGLPPWVIVFASWRNWIAAFVEASALPSMVLGLILAIRDRDTSKSSWLDRLAIVCAISGFCYSLYDFRGLNTLNQWLEIALVIGFLIGTYQLARQRMHGYLWYILMHLACGYLMWIQHYPVLAGQQLISLILIIDAYRQRRGQTRVETAPAI